ncbi:MAG: acetyl-CoA carboxylase biotin carboxyl carrier protein subunit [Bacteroidetes bacterium HGW-Bacteroidetes-14]|nr:MAG: acetyl-CoA carboxylase biotin carboxyl carrier protein subunit [Bacteroidetes bacterium HGW-Bacteroidetes-14]
MAEKKDHSLNKEKAARQKVRKGESVEPQYETLQIFTDARIYKTNLTKKYRNRKIWKKPDLQEIHSVIPGVVTSITVKEGEHVTKGAELMVYEAMKMQNIIRAPFDGTVDKIHVQAGEKTAKGVLMIYLKSDVPFDSEEPETISSVPGQDE